jgi:hypothetical protein
MSNPRPRNRLDTLALVLSGTCMVHCLVLPLLVTMFPIVGGSLVEEKQFHLLFLILVLPTSTIALFIGCRRHRDRLTAALGASGLAILVAAAFFAHDLIGPTGERVITLLGGLILSAGHILNFYRCHHVDCDHAAHPTSAAASGAGAQQFLVQSDHH